MLFLYWLSLLYINDTAHFNSYTDLKSNDFFCNKLEIVLGNDISLYCHTGGNSELIDDYVYSRIDVENNITVTYSGLDNFAGLSNLAQIIDQNAGLRVIFDRFTDMRILNSLINNYFCRYSKIWIAIDWNNPNACTFDSKIISGESLSEFNDLSDYINLRKICINNKAYLYYADEIEGKVVVIPQSALIISVCLTSALLIGMTFVLYFIAKWNYYKKDSVYP